MQRRKRRREPTIRIRCALCSEKVKLNRACSATIMYYMFVNTTVTFSRGRSLAEAFLWWGRAGSACHGGRLGTRGFVDATGDVSAHESRALIRVAVESCIIFGKLDGDTFDWPTPLAVTVSPLATSAPPRGRGRRSCAKTYFVSLPRARWGRMSRGWGVRGGRPNPKLAYDVRQSSHFTGSTLSAIRALDRHEQGCAMRGWSGG